MNIEIITRIIPDKIYLKMMYYKHFGCFPNLKNPKTFNEKLQWLKLHDRQEKYTLMSDKYEAKKYVANIIGEEYIIPTLGVWSDAKDIEWDSLPSSFVLKCNNDSGGVVICKNKSEVDIAKTIKFLNRRLKNNGYWYGREWPYRNIKPRIIAEKYIKDNDTKQSSSFGKVHLKDNSGDLTDYKFFCFNGYVDSVMVCLDRASGDTKFYFFDKDWNLKRLNIRGKNAPDGFSIPKPECMDDMFDVAATLSKGIPFVRIDLYQSNKHIYFGEITFFPASGFDSNLLPETDKYFGKLIDLRGVVNENRRIPN